MTISVATTPVTNTIFAMHVKRAIYGRNDYNIRYELGNAKMDISELWGSSVAELNQEQVGSVFSSSFFVSKYLLAISKVIDEIEVNGHFS